MSLTIHESFQVRVPPERAWRFLIDPAQVVRCLPGAELVETVDQRTYRGRVKVKVGPISTAYDGTAQLTEVDESSHRMRLVGEGKEIGAAGSARLNMAGIVAMHPEGGSLVEIEATIDIAGRVMQFGRGLVESVSRQLFKQFAESARTILESEEIATLSGDVPPTGSAVAGPAVVDIANTPEGLRAASSTASAPVAKELKVIPLVLRALADWFLRLIGRRK